MRFHTPNFFHKAYLLTLCAFLLAGAVSLGIHCAFAIRAPFELDYAEGLLLWQAQHVVNLESAFLNINDYPYVSFMYPPIYDYVAYYAQGLAGGLLAAGRWVSMLSALGIALLVGFQAWWAVPRRFGSFLRVGAAVASSLFCLTLSTMAWAQLMRVDMLALFFTFAGLTLFLMAARRPAWQYGAMFLFVLAMFTKQTQLAGPAACLLVASIIRPMQALRLLAFSLAVGLAGLTLLMVPTHGRFLSNMLVLSSNPFSLRNMLGMMQLNLAAMAPLAAVALVVALVSFTRIRSWAVVGSSIQHRPARRAVALGSIHLLLALAISLTCGKRGSNYNYFLEWNIACCLLVVFALVFILVRLRAHHLLLPEASVLLMLLIYASNGVASLAQDLRQRPPSTQQAESAAVVDLIRALPGPVYSENMTVLVQAGKEVPGELALITLLSESKTWDEAPLRNRVASRWFSAIIVTSSLENRNRYTVTMAQAIAGAYRLDRTIGGFAIYLPKP